MNGMPVHAAAALARGDHLTPPSPLGWSYWRDIEFRSAGFPATLATSLARPEAAVAADLANAAEGRAACLRRTALDALLSRIGGLRERIRAGAADGICPGQDVDLLRSLQEASRMAFKTRDLAVLIPSASADLAPALAEASTLARAARERYEQEYQRACLQSRAQAAAMAGDDRFREAVAWQNLAALRNAFDRLRADSQGSEAKLRSAEALVTAYAQRYSLKNDTIGFFGPEGWARFSDAAEHLSLACGPSLVEARRVYFEDWAIRTYAERLSANLRLRPWQIPRMSAQLRLEGANLYLPSGHVVELEARDAAVLASCDGAASAREIANSLCANPFGDFDTESDVLETLESLAKAHRVAWGFEVRVGDAHPERHLRKQLEAIDDGSLRGVALEGLDLLERGREALAAAAGDADAVAEALAALNDTFRQVTCAEPTRAQGETYGARTIVYEDCRRDIRLDLGIQAREKLQAPLDLILTSARWHCHQLAKQMRAALVEAHERLGGGSVAFMPLWFDVQDLFYGDGLNVSALQDEVVARWSAILPNGDDDTQVSFAASDIRSAVEASFEASDCGWRSACHQSPDVMVAARDPLAAAAGDLVYVLGELHMGLNTLICHSAYHQHVDPDSLLKHLGADLGRRRFIPLLSREGSNQPVRVQTVTSQGVDLELCFAQDARPLDARGAVSVGDLVVDRDGDTLVVRSHDGRVRADILDVLGESMSALAVNQFRMFGRRRHTPRISIDDLVVQRECWRVDAADLAGACAGTETDAFRFLRQWRLDAGLPEQVFVRSPHEVKPFYLDFMSPGLVRMLVKQLRRCADDSASLTFTELLPGTSDLWLRDAQGKPYTCEFRIVAVHQCDRDRPIDVAAAHSSSSSSTTP